MSHMSLSPNCAFGLRAEIRHGAFFLEDGVVAFPVGHNVVLHHLESKTQRFIPGLVESQAITAIAISPQRRQIAVAERNDQAAILIYDLQTLKRRKALISVETGTKEIVCLSFSQDGKLLAAQGGAPDGCLSIWAWEKSKLVASVKTTSDAVQSIHQCMFVPPSDGGVCVLGPHLFKQYRLTENSLKLQPHLLTKHENDDCRCAAWRNEELIVGYGDGTILCCEGSEITWRHLCANNDAVESLIKTTIGFVVGTRGGRVMTFEQDARERYLLSKNATLPCAAITHLAISPNREQLLCTTTDSQMFLLSFANMEMAAELRSVDPAFTTFHSSAIIGLSTCVRKQLIATSSRDKSIRLWNYFSKTTELVKHFTEECFSVALHPSGSSLVAGFADKLRLMTILMDDFKLVKEFPLRACRECRFANGGHQFAAVGGNTVFVYATYTCDVVATLRAHTGKVSSLFWSRDDAKLISAGLDGAIYEWNVREQKRERENVMKGCNYASVIATADFNNILAVGSDMRLKELEDIQGSGTQITKDVNTSVGLCQLAMPSSERMLFVGTQSGAIRTYKYPISGDYQEYKCQSDAISRLALASDGSLLVAASHDGSLFVLDVRETDLASKLRREQLGLPWAEEVFVSKAELDEKQQRMQELETKVNEITMQTEYQLRLKDLHLQEKLKETSDRHETEIETEKKRFELLSQEKNEMELEYEEKLHAHHDRAQQQLNALDSQYQQKILNEVERYQQLLQERDTLNKRWDEQNALLAEAHETTIQELTEEYEGKLHAEHLECEQLMTDKSTLEEEFEEIKKQLERDADHEVDELKRRYEKKLMDEREIGLRLKGQNGIMRKKFTALQSDIEAQKDEIKALFDQKRELYDTIASLEKDITGFKKSVKDRDSTISDKERRIYDLKKKNQELEKFKFVLDYKIKELKSLIEPKEEEIEQCKEQVREMDLELQQYHEANGALELVISNLRLKQSGLTRQVDLERRVRDQAKLQVENFARELEDVVQSIQYPKALKHKVIQMYRRHVQSVSCVDGAPVNPESEFERQRSYLEKTVEGLKLKSLREAKLNRANAVRSMQENSELIKEINALRKRVHSGRVAESVRSTDVCLADDAQKLHNELSTQRETIDELKSEIREKENRIRQLERSVISRPVSRERLPPVP